MTSDANRFNAYDSDVGIQDFWDDIGRADSVALLLDYDGTLAPFHVDRMQAFPSDGIVDALREIRDSGRTICALVSGRPVAEVLALLPDPGVTIIGTHGFEVRHPGEDISTTAISPQQGQLLDRALDDAQLLVGKARTERKVATVAAHFRGLDRLDARETQQNLLERWLTYADTSAVEVRQFNGGLEMRALGRHKGLAVADFLDTCPDNVLAVYVGDDDTDEDAFKTVNERRGFAIRVGKLNETTAASGSIPTCADVPGFLQTWIKVRQ